jgi:hypothetical protein
MYPLLDTYRKLVTALGAKDVLGNGTSALTWNPDGTRAGGLSIHPYGIEINTNDNRALILNDGTHETNNPTWFATLPTA